jgi:hypothetical protein
VLVGRDSIAPDGKKSRQQVNRKPVKPLRLNTTNWADWDAGCILGIRRKFFCQIRSFLSGQALPAKDTIELLGKLEGAEP